MSLGICPHLNQEHYNALVRSLVLHGIKSVLLCLCIDIVGLHILMFHTNTPESRSIKVICTIREVSNLWTE